jgi:hypothetical protein
MAVAGSLQAALSLRARPRLAREVAHGLAAEVLVDARQYALPRLAEHAEVAPDLLRRTFEALEQVLAVADDGRQRGAQFVAEVRDEPPPVLVARPGGFFDVAHEASFWSSACILPTRRSISTGLTS